MARVSQKRNPDFVGYPQKYHILTETSFSKHCNIKLDKNRILVTGGRTGSSWHPNMNEIRSSTLYVNMKTNKWVAGYSMNWKRYGHGCAKFLFGPSNRPMAIGN